MKRLGVLFATAALLLSLAVPSHATDVKATGYWWIEAISRQNWDFLGHGAPNGEDNTFSVEQKLRTAFTFTANENLRAILDTQIGSVNWGSGFYQIGSGRSSSTVATTTGANTAGYGNIMLRKGYIEYKWPGTLVNISVGFQTVTLPAAFGGGSAIMDDQVAAAVVSTPITDNISLTAGYARPLDSQSAGTTSIAGHGTSMDVVFAALPIDYKGVNVTPFAMYANAGYNSRSAGSGATSLPGFAGPNSSLNEGMQGYWGGVAFTMKTLEPFKIMADFNYGKATYNNQGSTNAAEGGRSGFLFDLAVDYTGLNFMTPELFFAYSSGENGNSSKRGGSERMPVVAVPQNWSLGTGSFFFGERWELGGSINTTAGYTCNTLGYWSLGVVLKDISLVDKLSHNFTVLYAKGTNSKDYLYEKNGNVRSANYGGFLTEKDSLWEVDLNTKYKIYNELTAYLFLGYINADFDKNVWGNSNVANAADIKQYGSKDAYKVGFGLNYFF
jgi:hypothetical protein